jgi:ribonuclease BN (tRNA processing enzyme)
MPSISRVTCRRNTARDGHSLVQQACQLAVAAEAKHLILFHHDPVRTDDGLDAILED